MTQDTFKFEENGEEYKIIKVLNPSNILYDYIIYTNDNDNENIYASRYKVINEKIELFPIEEEYEWDYLDKYLMEANNGK